METFNITTSLEDIETVAFGEYLLALQSRFTGSSEN